MSLQNTLVLVKPDAVRRNLIGSVLTKIDETKLTLIAGRLCKVSLELAKEHYAQHEGKHFYAQLLEYITGKLHGGPAGERVMALVYRGEDAIKKIRAIAGETNPEKALPDTLRGMFGRITTAGVFENVVHASATPMEAEREIKLWFSPDEIVESIYPAKQNGTGKKWEKIPTIAELG